MSTKHTLLEKRERGSLRKLNNSEKGVHLISFVLKILVNILLKLATTGVFSFMMPTLLKLDKWCEDRLGLDIIKQDKKFQEKYPLIAERLTKLEDNSHPCKELHEFDVYPELIKRIEDLEKK